MGCNDMRRKGVKACKSTLRDNFKQYDMKGGEVTWDEKGELQIRWEGSDEDGMKDKWRWHEMISDVQ